MGWFWADVPPEAKVAPSMPHPLPRAGTTPPPSCPMHKADGRSTPLPSRSPLPSEQPTSCPVKSKSNHPLRDLLSPPTSNSRAIEPTAQPTSASVASKLNPLNYIPSALSNTRDVSSPQSISLPLERETSSIPRGDAHTNWEYPSPQQMYNAMLRKGYTDTPADAVESMVAVHNFLNEGAWNEIVEWESIFSKGLVSGWEKCRRGEEGIAMERAKQEMALAKEEFAKARRRHLGLPETTSNSTQLQQNNRPDDDAKPKLLRFMGRPSEPTPKARILSMLGTVFPEKFGGEPPFDRHDWFVARRTPSGEMKEVRYVIDYYSGGVQATGEPVFYLDIRPALDTPTAAAERAMRWGGDIWWRASGGRAREEMGSASGKTRDS